jgi:hypothetical protein
MKPFITPVILLALICSTVAVSSPAKGRTLTDINVISPRVLKGSISPKFYKSLLISPIEGWVVVRAKVAGTHLSAIKVIHSELNGAYDQVALQLAKEMQIAGYYSIERPYIGGAVLLHLLVYQIADGTMVLSFPTFDEPGGDQLQYRGCARLAVLKRDGTWTEIEGPESLRGKGWAVRQGFRNKMEAILKLEAKRVPLDG